MSDLIDRQAVIDLLKQMRKDGDMVPWEGKDVFARIRKLPTIQPEPHEGHWIEGKIYRDVIECNCSECGQLMTTAASVRMNYCPNCGAKMINK